MISQKIAEYILETEYSKLPAEVTRLVKVCVLDWLGCTIAGEHSESGQIFIDLIRELGGAPESTVIPTGDKTSCVNAALVNGALSHVLELDDIHRLAMYHPGVPIIPVAFALGERQRTDGKDFISSLYLGYEIGIRIGIAINPSHFEIWHTTGTVGSLAASVVAGKILRLDRTQMNSAFGNAGTQAAGLWQFNIDGAMTKPMHAGKAAMNGLLAALLAQKGFTGATHILEGKKGFGTATSEKVDYDSITADLGQKHEFLGIGTKVHVGCRHSSSATDGTLQLVTRYDLKPEEIDSVCVRIYQLGLDLTGNPSPKTVSEARFSIPYCVAVAVLFRQCGDGQFNQETIRNPEVRKMLKKITVALDDEIERDYPMGYASLVEIRTKDGRLLSERTNHAKGDPENPVSPAEIEDKFRRLTEGVLSPSKADALISVVKQLEQVDDINQLIPLCVKD
jgi:2-methylcitrate dehydratase PrpD